MADPASPAAVLTRRHPLESRRSALAALGGPVTITLEPLVSAVDLRVDPDGDALTALGAALGGELPTTPDTWTPLPDGGQALRLGPDEWLLTCTTEDPHRWEDRVDGLAAPYGGMAVDVSAQRVGLRIHGAARDLLAYGCSIDLRPHAFGRGRCAQTLLGQAAVLLVAHGDDDLRVHVRSSFAGYVADRLLDSARDDRLVPA